MRRFGQLACLISLCALSCSQPAPPINPPDWKTTSIDLGQGQMQVGVRFRWVAERDGMGAAVRTPDGGEAQVRIFACGKPVGELMELLRQKLRWRLVGNEINRSGRAVTFRYWKGQGQRRPAGGCRPGDARPAADQRRLLHPRDRRPGRHRRAGQARAARGAARRVPAALRSRGEQVHAGARG
jgi:hypothetical protein